MYFSDAYIEKSGSGGTTICDLFRRTNAKFLVPSSETDGTLGMQMSVGWLVGWLDGLSVCLSVTHERFLL